MDTSLLLIVFWMMSFVFMFVALVGIRPVSYQYASAAGLSALVSWFFLRKILADSPLELIDSQSVTRSAIVLAIAAGVLAGFNIHGYTLAGTDPVTVPTLAKTILAHGTTLTTFRPGDPGFAYPPGHPILFSLISMIAPPLLTIGAFKILSVAIVAFIPVSWAWLAYRVFRVPIPFWAVLALSYLAFFGLERSITFSLQFGKNAQMLIGALFPWIAGIILLAYRRWSGIPFAAIVVAAAVLTHYSAIYLATTFFAGYLLVTWPRDREGWSDAFRLALAGVIGFGLFLLLNAEALHDPRVAAFGSPDISGGLSRIFAMLTERSDETVFIFQSIGVIGSPYRGAVLIACTLFALGVSWAMHGTASAVALRRFTGTMAIMVLFTLAFAAGLIPAGIYYDFARWYLIFPTSGLFLAGLCALYIWATGRGSVLTRASLISVAAVGAMLALYDLAGRNSASRVEAIRWSDLVQVRDVIETISAAEPGPCYLVTESNAIFQNIHRAQRYRPLEYAELLTECTIINGSFVRRGVPGSREMGGLPKATVMSALPNSATVLLVARDSTMTRWSKEMPAVEFAQLPLNLGPLPIWRLTLNSTR